MDSSRNFPSNCNNIVRALDWTRQIAYSVLMKLRSASFALLAVLVVTAVVTYRSAEAQIRQNPILRVGGSAPDYHLVRTADYVYRYDSKSGLTHRLAITSAGGTGKDVKYNWLTVIDGSPGALGEAGRYEVIEGHGSTSILVRTDTMSGRTWVAIQATIFNWQEVTAN